VIFQDTWQGWTLFVLVLGEALGFGTFSVYYALRAKWWHTEIGRSILYLQFVSFLIYMSVIVSVLVPDYWEWWAWFLPLHFVFVFLIWRQAWQLRRSLRGRKE
jgi:hypothetical protein